MANRVGRRFRLKLRDETVSEEWSPWLISPVADYLETVSDGPWPGRLVEWVEIELFGTDVVAGAGTFAAVGLAAEVVGGFVRVSLPV